MWLKFWHCIIFWQTFTSELLKQKSFAEKTDKCTKKIVRKVVQLNERIVTKSSSLITNHFINPTVWKWKLQLAYFRKTSCKFIQTTGSLSRPKAKNLVKSSFSNSFTIWNWSWERFFLPFYTVWNSKKLSLRFCVISSSEF